MKEATRDALKRIAENDPSFDGYQYVCHHLILSSFFTFTFTFTFTTLTPSLLQGSL
jgi:hypothetical protein